MPLTTPSSLIWIVCLLAGSVTSVVSVGVNNGLFLTPYIEKGRFAEARKLSMVPPVLKRFGSSAGYLTVDSEANSNLFFWLFRAQRGGWESRPLIVWLGGEIGRSAMFAALEELGPFYLYKQNNKDKCNTSKNNGTTAQGGKISTRELTLEDPTETDKIPEETEIPSPENRSLKAESPDEDYQETDDLESDSSYTEYQDVLLARKPPVTPKPGKKRPKCNQTRVTVPRRRKFSWNRRNNVLFIDSPVGTGFSFTDSKAGYARSLGAIARDLHSALSQLLTLFPSLQRNKLYLAGSDFSMRVAITLGRRLYYFHQATRNRTRSVPVTPKPAPVPTTSSPVPATISPVPNRPLQVSVPDPSSQVPDRAPVPPQVPVSDTSSPVPGKVPVSAQVPVPNKVQKPAEGPELGPRAPVLNHVLKPAHVPVPAGVFALSGWIDPIHYTKRGEVLYNAGMLDERQLHEIKQMEEKIRLEIRAQNYREASRARRQEDKKILEMTGFWRLRDLRDETKSSKDRDLSLKYLNSTSVRSDIHVGNRTLNSGAEVAAYLAGQDMMSMKSILEELLKTEAFPIMFLSGQQDVVSSYTSSLDDFASLEWPRAREYFTAKRCKFDIRNEVVAYYKTAGIFTEVLVRNAGHRIPRDQNRWVMELIDTYLTDRNYFKCAS